MVLEARVVVHELVELDSLEVRLFGVRHRLALLVRQLARRFVPVALKVATGRATVLLPRLQANPTKLNKIKHNKKNMNI